jgi:crotonobetainyl-CoA:carnitine CoA-transferase CaiB-like acyl-CoA transferase
MSGALDGTRVIDFGKYLAGPLAALLLADQGAEVIRVDPPGGPAGGIPPMPYCSVASAASCWTLNAPMKQLWQ